MMSSMLLISIGAVVGVFIFVIILWLVTYVKKKRKVIPPIPKPVEPEPVKPEPKPFERPEDDYVPIGKVGFVRIRDAGNYGVIIVEEIDRINNQEGSCYIKIKILDVTLDFDNFNTEADLLRQWGGNVWCGASGFNWHERTEAEKRQDKIDGIVGDEKNSA